MSATAGLLTAIKARADGDTGAGGLFASGAAIITGWYSLLGPQETASADTIYPFVVASPIDHRRLNAFDATDFADEIFMQFALYCDGKRDLTTDQTVVDAIITRFDRWAPTVSGYTPSQLIHDGSNLIQQDDNIRQHIIEMRCLLGKT